MDQKFDEFRLQCESGDERGCHSLAEYLQLIKHDEAEALRIFIRNCDPPEGSKHRRYSPSCFSAASLLLGMKRGTEAVSFFEKACAAGSIEACANLSVMHRRGMAGTAGVDVVKADAFAEQACTGGDSKSCFQMGVSSKSRNDGPSALHYFEKAYLLGYPWGCSNAYIMLTRGDGVAVDLERAGRLKELGENVSKSLGLKIV